MTIAEMPEGAKIMSDAARPFRLYAGKHGRLSSFLLLSFGGYIWQGRVISAKREEHDARRGMKDGDVLPTTAAHETKRNYFITEVAYL